MADVTSGDLKAYCLETAKRAKAAAAELTQVTGAQKNDWLVRSVKLLTERSAASAAENQLGIKEGETTEEREYTLDTVACIGACGLSPCIMTNKKVAAKLTPKKVAKLFRKAGKDDES